MGIIVAKFRRKQSTYDVLFKLEGEITSIEAFQRSTEEARKKIIFRFILLAVLIYILTSILLYLYFAHSPNSQKLYFVATLVAFPIVIWIIKQVLTWYYNQKIKRNENKLVTLKERKHKILDNVMETETYKVAKKILDKFGNEREKVVDATPLVNRNTSIARSAVIPPNTALRQRTLAAQNSIRGRMSFGGAESPMIQKMSVATPIPGPPTSTRPTTSLHNTSQMPLRPPASPYSQLPLPRGILPRERSIMDKMMDYLVGDGPSNRYALICKECHSHNGMAAMDEFEYLSFRCCYCSAFNPSRKKKPSRPKLEAPTLKVQSKSSSSESSDSEVKFALENLEPNRRSDSPDTLKTSEFDKLSDIELKSSDNDISPVPMDIDSHESHQIAERPTTDSGPSTDDIGKFSTDDISTNQPEENDSKTNPQD